MLFVQRAAAGFLGRLRGEPGLLLLLGLAASLFLGLDAEPLVLGRLGLGLEDGGIDPERVGLGDLGAGVRPALLVHAQGVLGLVDERGLDRLGLWFRLGFGRDLGFDALADPLEE